MPRMIRRLLAFALFLPLGAASAEDIVTLSTRGGVTQCYLLSAPEAGKTRAVAILFPGGAGKTDLERETARKALDRVRQGAAIALVTDAGTPAVSDPGAELVRLALREGIPVRAVPGPSALTALLSVAGIEDRTFCFRGFFPRGEEAGVREAALAAGTRASRTFVWFESPGRVESTVGILARQCPGARLVAGKELTKLHEKVFSGPAPESAREIALEIAREGARGEWVIALVAEPARPGESHAMEAKNSEETWKIALECAIAAGARPSSAASIVGQKFGVARNVVYERALELGGKKSSRGT